MEIQPDLKLNGLRLGTAPAEVRNWRVGQVLAAVATGNDRGGVAPLRIGTASYTAQVPFPVRSGDRLVLEVIRAGTQPLLRPLSAERSPDPVQAALRTALPRQGGLPPLLAALGALTGARELPGVPAPVAQAARQLFSSLLDVRQVREPGALRRAMSDAGTLLEAKLARTAAGGEAPAPERDLKAGMLRLQQALSAAARAPGTAPPPSTAMRAAAPAPPAPATVPGPAPATSAAGAPPTGTSAPLSQAAPPLLPPLAELRPEPQARVAPPPFTAGGWPQLLGDLLKDVEAALARLQLQQLGSQAPDGEPRQVWLLELPIRREAGADVWQFRLERDAGTESDARAPGGGWTVELAFDLEGLGPVRARIQLQAGQVSTRFWAQRAATVELFQGELHRLRTALEAAGVPVSALACHHGTPPEAGRPSTAALLDERA